MLTLVLFGDEIKRMKIIFEDTLRRFEGNGHGLISMSYLSNGDIHTPEKVGMP